jgi:hypothetical protein
MYMRFGRLEFGFVFSLVGMAALAISGCGGSAPSAVQPMEIASDAGTKAVESLDTNHDQLLDYKELAKAPGLRAALASIKKVGSRRGPPPTESQLKDLKISASDIDARIQDWRDRKTGRVSISCRVVRLKKGSKGPPQPVAGAEVKCVPESFLGPALSTGKGTTDKSGMATVSQPSRGAGDPDNGMCPGFYRVEITKGSEIPAKYNKDTTLGIEVAADAQTGGGNTFELDY